MDKVQDERNTLEVALPLLRSLYGKFNVDCSQTDRPDAAIVLADGRRIGIEITSLDLQEHQQYMKDQGIGRAATIEQSRRITAGLPIIEAPTKKLQIQIAREYLATGALAKAGKYNEYMVAGGYDEIVLLTTSCYLTASHKGFDTYYVPKASFVFGTKNFPFDKVAFVCHHQKSAKLVYEKAAPVQAPPREELFPDESVESSTVTVPAGKSIALARILREPPLAPNRPRPKSKRKPRPSKSTKR